MIHSSKNCLLVKILKKWKKMLTKLQRNIKRIADRWHCTTKYQAIAPGTKRVKLFSVDDSILEEGKTYSFGLYF